MSFLCHKTKLTISGVLTFVRNVIKFITFWYHKTIEVHIFYRKDELCVWFVFIDVEISSHSIRRNIPKKLIFVLKKIYSL